MRRVRVRTNVRVPVRPGASRYVLLLRLKCVLWGLEPSSPRNPTKIAGRPGKLGLHTRFAVLSNLPPDEQPTELLANTMRILDRVSDLETHVKFLTHHIQQLLAAGGAVTPGQTPASTPHATPAFGLSPARESASPPPQQQQFNPFQPLVPYATAAQMAAPPPPPPQA